VKGKKCNKDKVIDNRDNNFVELIRIAYYE